MPKKTKIEVTERDIETGVFGSPWHCPVAEAVRRTFSITGRRAVGAGFDLRIGSYTQPSPKSVRRFIAKFDTGQTVKPFTFSIQTPPDEHKGASL